MGTGRKHIILFAFLLAVWGSFPHILSAQKVRIGIYDDQAINTVVFHCISGKYEIMGDSVFSLEISGGDLVYINLVGEKLVLMDGDQHSETFSRLTFRNTDETAGFRLKLVDPAKVPRNYNGLLEINQLFGAMQLINELSLNDYLAGVVEAEGGPSALPEYYKAQAILCRSYSFKNWEKHPNQGFNLCDNTHCQVFHGISEENPAIPDAVLATTGLVLTDQKSFIVPAIFHSNSGGETQRATDLWNSGDDYLQAVLDPFSEGLRSAKWEKVITLEQWKQYLMQHSKSGISKLADDQILVKQDHRKKYFLYGNDSLRLADIRTDLELRSTFFTMEVKNDSILIHGKGYGHGVGMSQEGAMEMAKQGYSFSDILRFYFYNVKIIEMADARDPGLPETFK